MLPFPKAAPDQDLSTLEPGDVFNPFRIFNCIFIPDPIVDDPELTPTEKMAYGILARFCGRDGRCFPSVSTLAVRLKVSNRQTRNVISKLTDRRFILRVYEGGRVFYYFLWHESFEGRTRKRSTDDQEGQGAETRFRGGRKSISGATKEETHPKETTTPAHVVVVSSGGDSPPKNPEPAEPTRPENTLKTKSSETDLPPLNPEKDASPDHPDKPDTDGTGRPDSGIDAANGKVNAAENRAARKPKSRPISRNSVPAANGSDSNRTPEKPSGGPAAESPAGQTSGRHPDPPKADPVNQALARIRNDVAITAGIRRMVARNLEQYGEERVLRNIVYCNPTGNSPKTYCAYLDRAIEEDWGIDCDPYAVQPPPSDPAKTDREFLIEIERRHRETEAERAEALAIGAAFLRLSEDEQMRLRAAFLDRANRFEQRRAAKLSPAELAKNLSFTGFLKSRNLNA